MRKWSPETDLAQALADSFPPLASYCPILDQISLPQARFIVDDCREALYGGAVGGGKSAALLMGALQYADLRGYRALILRRTYAELSKGDALIPLSHEWLGGSSARWNELKKTWTFPSGATIEFGHVQHEEDKRQYQGAAYHYVGFDELTHFTESQYDFIAFSRQRRRMDFARAGIPVRVRSTANPGGVGHGWVKRRFIDDRADGVTFVPAKIWDNPGLDAEDYASSLAHLPDALRKQLLDGDWGAFEGMAYPDFDPAVHCVDLPIGRIVRLAERWLRWESMDYGSRNPTAWLLFGQDYDGNTIVLDSYYQANELPDVHAAEVLRRREEWWERVVDGKRIEHVAYGDKHSIREHLTVRNRMGDPMTLQDQYGALGVNLTPGNARRVAGYVRVAEMLKRMPEALFPEWHERYGQRGSPRLFFCAERCRELVGQLQVAPMAAGETDPLRGEAVDGRWEGDHGHAHAALRYGLLSREPDDLSKRPEPELDPRAELLRKYAESPSRRRDMIEI